jgi:hypothetical protein
LLLSGLGKEALHKINRRAQDGQGVVVTFGQLRSDRRVAC